MHKRALFSLMIIIASSFSVFAQANLESFAQTYWNLKSEFQKRFVIIGQGDGKSIPIAALDPTDHYGTPCGQSTGLGIARFGDEPQLQGYYIAVLASEYALLDQTDGNTAPTLNELYYAILAINRMDFRAEEYLSQGNAAGSVNGLLVRDDAPSDFMDEFTQSQYPITLDIRDLRYPCIESDGYNVEWFSSNPVAPFNKGNYMSQDHVFNLFMGLALVKKYVPNVFVKPTNADPGFFIIDEVQAIVSRIMNYIVAGKTFYENACVNPLLEDEIYATWSICNPITLHREHPISQMHLFSYPLAIAAQYINGIDYTSFPVVWDYPPNANHPPIICKPPCSTTPSGLQDFWNEVGLIPTFSATANYPIIHCFAGYGCSLEIGNFETTEWPQLRMNAYLTMLIGTVSGTIAHSKIVQMGDEFNKSQIFDLVYCSLHNQFPGRAAGYYENLLGEMPCEGPHNFNYGNTSFSDESWPWNTTMLWAQGMPQGQDYDGSLGEYNGLDWMLLYNLYRLNYPSSYSSYKDNSCPCDGSNAKIDLTIDPNNNLTSGVVLNRKFPQYVDFDIKLKEYLTHDLQIANPAGLGTFTDLVVCNNATMDVQAGGFVFADNTADDEGSIVFRKGTILHLESGSALTVHDRCKVIIEEGAKLIVDQNASIQLLGDNALLDIKGTLVLGPNANFTFTHPNVNSGYVRFSRESWVTYDPTAPDYQIIASPGSSMEFVGDNKNDRVLEIAQSSLFIPDALNHFKVYQGMVDFAGVGNQSPALSIGSPIVSLTWARFEREAGTNGGNGVVLYGQPNHTIFNCVFEGLAAGLTALNFYNIGQLKISASRFNQCGTGLDVYDKGVDLSACRFENCYDGAVFNGLTFNSTITTCKFNNNGNLGIDAKGSPVEIAFTNCEMKNNGIAGINSSGVTINLTCSDLRNNGQYAMIIDIDGSLRMSPVYNGGHNDLGNNPIPVLLNEANQVEISGGRNNLKPQGQSCTGNSTFISCPDVFIGTVQTNCTPTVIDAKNNEWKSNTQNYSFLWNNQPVTDLPLTVAPISAVGCTSVPVRFSDPVQMSYQQCSSSPNGPPNGGGGPPQLSPLNSCTNCNTINTASFQSTPTDSAARTTLRSMDTTIANGYADAVTMFNEILTYPLAQESEGDRYVKNASDRKMHEALGEGIRRGQISYSSTTLSTEAQAVINVEAADKIDGENSGDYYRRYFAAMREAEAYRAAGKRDIAIQKFDDILTWVQIVERPWTEYWRCLTATEQMVLSGQIAKEQFRDEIEPCIPRQQIPASALRTQSADASAEENSAPAFNAKVYPNPVTAFLFVQVDQEETENATMEIYTSTGQRVMTEQISGPNANQIDVSGLAEGLYYYRIISALNEQTNGKLLIVQ